MVVRPELPPHRKRCPDPEVCLYNRSKRVEDACNLHASAAPWYLDMKNRKTAPWRAPVVEEIRRNWEKYARKFDFDLEKICSDLKRQQEATPGPVVSFKAKPPTAATPPTAPARPSKHRDT